MDKVNTFISNTMNSFDQWMVNPYFATTVTIILSVYASLASPNLPNFLKRLFDNSIFKILIISFIAYRANKNPQLSLMVAVCFVITLNFLAEKENKEAFEQIETFNQLEYFSNTLDTNGNIEPINPEPINPEPINSEPINPEPINPEPTNLGPINLDNIMINSPNSNSDSSNSDSSNSDSLISNSSNSDKSNSSDSPKSDSSDSPKSNSSDSPKSDSSDSYESKKI